MVLRPQDFAIKQILENRIDTTTRGQMKISPGWIIVMAAILLSGVTARANKVEFLLDAEVINLSDGHIKLQWKAENNTTFELQQATTANFSNAATIYQGPDQASFISGLKDGDYFYRVRAVGRTWSKPLLIKVEHQSLTLAFTLFGVGAVVFLLTVLVVVKGVRQVAKGRI